jgi:hypothetical protein
MAKTQTYSIEKILAVRETLRNLPVKEREKSGAEVMGFLKTDLRKAVKQGHSLKDIQAILAEQGISVSLSGLETVLGQLGKISVQKKAGSHPAQSIVQKTKPQEEVPKKETVKPPAPNLTTAQQNELRKMPSYYTPDLPDDQL